MPHDRPGVGEGKNRQGLETVVKHMLDSILARVHVLTMTNELVTGDRGGNETWECPDCGMWEYKSSSKAIRHSKRCDCNAQPVSPAAPAEETATQRRARVQRGHWDTAAEVTNEFGYGDKANRVGLDTDY